MRQINNIVVHCTATPQNVKIEAIQNYWRKVLGWHNPGYHYIIEASGDTHHLQHDSKVANGVRGRNADSLHIAYIGGIDERGKAIDNRTNEQKIEMYYLLLDLLDKYYPARLMGHRDFPNVNKACPSFDVKMWYQNPAI